MISICVKQASLNLLLVWVSTNLKWVEDLVDFGCHAPSPYVWKQQRYRWFKNKQLSPSAERFRMIPSAVNSSFASVMTLERKEERRRGAGDRPSDEYTAGDICEQPSEWEKQSDTSTVGKWHLISVDSSSWTRGDLWRGRKAQRQCQIDVMIIHILPSAHFRSAKDKLKEKYRCLTSPTALKLSSLR